MLTVRIFEEDSYGRRGHGSQTRLNVFFSVCCFNGQLKAPKRSEIVILTECIKGLQPARQAIIAKGVLIKVFLLESIHCDSVPPSEGVCYDMEDTRREGKGRKCGDGD